MSRNSRPRMMVHPGKGARARYTQEYKCFLNSQYRAGAMYSRAKAADTALVELAKMLKNGESHLAFHSPDTLAALRKHVIGSKRAIRRASRIPAPQPVRWDKMRSIEMSAYRRQLRAFDKWDRRVAYITEDTKCIQVALKKLDTPRRAPPGTGRRKPKPFK